MEIMIFVLGICVGSFINMYVYRLAIKERLLCRKTPCKDFGGRSFCDFCGRQLNWYENIPIISWLVLGGKTKCCHNPLPWEYPVVEMGTGLLFLLNYQLSIINYELIIIFIIISLLIFNLVFDLKYMILPDRANGALILLSLFLLIGKIDYINYVLTGIASLLFFFLLNRIKIRGSEAMGMGDVKYSLFMGLFLGYLNTVVAVYFAFVVGAVLSIVLLLSNKIKKENPIPFGPFLIGGTVVAWFWGKEIFSYFFGVLF